MDKFRLDFRKIDLLELKRMGILPKDVEKLFVTVNSRITVFPGHSYAIGYVREIKFIHTAYNISKNVNFDIELLQVGIPNGREIKRYWCARKNKN